MKRFFKLLLPFFISGGYCIALLDIKIWMPHGTYFGLQGISNGEFDQITAVCLFCTAAVIALAEILIFYLLDLEGMGSLQPAKDLVTMLGGYTVTMMGAALAGPVFLAIDVFLPFLWWG